MNVFLTQTNLDSIDEPIRLYHEKKRDKNIEIYRCGVNVTIKTYNND